jgi:hypothetical protein
MLFHQTGGLAQFGATQFHQSQSKLGP